MKTVTITCDFCKQEIRDEHISLGSKDEVSLHFHNNMKDGTVGLNLISNHSDLHFCCKQHFIEFFFNKPF